MNPASSGQGLRTDALGWLLISLALVAAPHITRLPPWISLLCVVFALWRLAIQRGGYRLPARVVLLLFTLLGGVGVYAEYGTLFGRDAGAALLILMLGLKLLEMRTLRDAMVVIFLGYFLVIINFLYSETIPTALYMVLVVWVITASLINLNHPGEPYPPWRLLRLGGLLLLQAVPLTLVLFVLFPRVSGPLWGLPDDTRHGVSGLSDEMTPGSIGSLSLSDAVAFRVEFEGGTTVSPQTLYWRGPVFWHYDGRTWSPGAPASRMELSLAGFDKPLQYSVTLEPHQQRWLFALDMPAIVPPGGDITSEFQLLSTKPVRQRLRYAMTSYPRYQIGLELTGQQRRRGLQLPAGTDPRSRTLVAQWRTEGSSDQEIVERALSMLRNQPFFYTLRAPPLGDDPVDDFLFETRRGFCEHFASGFAVLMRMAGIPTRVVTGYQGGEFNPLGDYLIVRQADAHAWVEVWLPQRGWVRVDPTAAVAPERVERGSRAVWSVADTPALVRINRDWLRRARLVWDAVNNGWNQWVLDYGPRRQTELLSRMGFGTVTWEKMAFALAAATSALLLMLGAIILRNRRPAARDPVLAAYQRFCTKLTGAGLPRRPSEGPADFAQRVKTHRPELRERVELITRLYVELRYGPRRSEALIKQLQRLVQEFRTGRSRGWGT